MNLNIGYTQLILAECRASGLLRNQAAYVLATAFWETARSMEPVKETVQANHKDRNPSDAEVMRRLDVALAKGQLKRAYWRGGYFGRGFVQLTHATNYARAGKALNLNLTANPSQALNPDVAAKILVQGMLEGWFTGKKLADYITLSQSDFKGARRIINGTDKAAEIAAIAKDYDAALLADGYGVTAPRPDHVPVIEKHPPVANPGFWAALFAAIFGGRK